MKKIFKVCLAFLFLIPFINLKNVNAAGEEADTSDTIASSVDFDTFKWESSSLLAPCMPNYSFKIVEKES
ncbi:MAG: hypothetical protein RR630_07540, partial [Coprobacillus sp.]